MAAQNDATTDTPSSTVSDVPQDAEVAQRIAQITERVAPEKTPKDVVFDGSLPLHIAAGVFDPSRGKSARKMAAAIRLCPPANGSRVLEIGTGSGVLSLVASQTAKNLQQSAVDILPEAVVCAGTNFKNHGLPVVPRLSDLFAKVAGNYDYIIFNAPTAHPSVQPDNAGRTSLWDLSGSLKRRFVEGAREHWQQDNPDARILMMYSIYRDYDSLRDVELSGFDQHRLFIDKDALSESGVIMLTPTAAPR